MRDFALALHPLTTALGRLRDLDLSARAHRAGKSGRRNIARTLSIEQIRTTWKRVAGRNGRRRLRQSIAAATGD